MSFPDFPVLKVDPSTLVRVRHSNGLDFNVLADKLEGSEPYLNTYTRNGSLIRARGCTRPISRSEIVGEK